MNNSLKTNMILGIAFSIMSMLFLIGCGEHSDHDDHKGHDHSEHEGHNLKSHDHSNHEGHDHNEYKEKGKHDPLVVGPRGGKVLSHPGHRVELWVDGDRKVHLSSLDEKGDRTSLTEFSVSAISGDRSSPTKVTFKKVSDEWVSVETLPEGKKIPFILTTQANGETFLDRIDLKLWNCGGCDLMEYACTCTH